MKRLTLVLLFLTSNSYSETINGHTLPPEPDPKINNSTLQGIDSNNNGVRDDVERWIYKTYKDKHPVHIDIAMQAGRDYKKVLKAPERAKEITRIVDSVISCESYYMVYAKYFNQPILVKERIDDKVNRKYFNTRERKRILRHQLNISIFTQLHKQSFHA